jgi:hypothetical protein
MEYIAFFMVVVYHTLDALEYLIMQHDKQLLLEYHAEYHAELNRRNVQVFKTSLYEDKVNWKKEGF